MTIETRVAARPGVERRAAMPAGFRAGGLAAGIKASGRPDVALIVADRPVAAAAVFTPNAFAAAPVRLSRSNLAAGLPAGGGRFGTAAAVISTSGCANAATGAAGDADQVKVGSIVAAEIGIDPLEVLHLSTGLIGTRLPLDRVAAGVNAVAVALEASDAGLLAAAEALRTTDSVI
jgi:glutamate N-acetyltransferase/amino-acid N-acetyltransferase